MITIINCPDCNREISSNNIKKHIGSKACLKIQDDNKFGIVRKKGFCPHCDLNMKDKSFNEIGSHVAWCSKNPKRDTYLTTLENTRNIFNSDRSIKSQKAISEGIKNAHKEGKYINAVLNATGKKGKPHTAESKAKISKAMRAMDYQRVCKKSFDYICKDGSVVKMDSTWEKRVAVILDENNIDWIRAPSLKWIDVNGKYRRYYADFYLTKYNIFLDPKNDWVIKTQSEKLNYLEKNYNNVYIMRGHELTLDYIQLLIYSVDNFLHI